MSKGLLPKHMHQYLRPSFNHLVLCTLMLTPIRHPQSFHINYTLGLDRLVKREFYVYMLVHFMVSLETPT